MKSVYRSPDGDDIFVKDGMPDNGSPVGAEPLESMVKNMGYAARVSSLQDFMGWDILEVTKV
jgi:hypothetical protein